MQGTTINLGKVGSLERKTLKHVLSSATAAAKEIVLSVIGRFSGSQYSCVCMSV